ncbi:hypothetical protein KR49_00140 [Synechococcus sp. KORDI-49]|nr:hypothetical protein KR49_00140 [Synechococcus sp. KORDI-49]
MIIINNKQMIISIAFTSNQGEGKRIVDIKIIGV